MIAGILLAAGAGSRFGGAKLLAELGDGRVLAQASAEPLVAAADEVVAVVRPGDARLEAILAASGCRIVHCKHAADGMGSSLACGVRAAADAQGWVVGLADMPGIGTATVARVVAALRRGADLVAPACRGRRGHPVGFARRYGAELAVLAGDTGARGILQQYAARMELLDTDDAGVLADVDTPGDLEALAQAISREPGGEN
ncbi:nucleotidyltransferase family protein [Aquisalimonas lutea]|uniref:nucleotidyltransferase family protein n=1 Tax=Aquisalimonas lutea TaxID=1327750 RepID=UPI0025B533B9|nr:nucleotidyltransferase family protein [Aquisalimonas lutea]MDN3519325.1 nucleotidyltransferase family protein [Aquisalimonas lutea]